ncbi:MAG: helix-turn-helix domain-containing protein [Spirochaetia bacterium]
MKHAQRSRSRVFRKIFLLFLIPVGLITAAGVANLFYYRAHFKTEIVSEYRKNLERLGDNFRIQLQELHQSLLLISSIDSIETIANQKAPVDLDDMIDIRKMMDIFAAFRSSRVIIADSYLYHREHGIIISGAGINQAPFFFSQTHSYADYDADFWESLNPQSRELRVLDPTFVNSYSMEKAVLPVVLKGVGSISSNSLFIVDIDINELAEFFTPYIFTDDTVLLMLRQGDPLFSAGARVSDGKVQGNRSVIPVVHHDVLFNMDVSYTALIPSRAVAKRMAFITLVTLLIIAISFLLALIFAYFLSKRVYRPIRGLVSLFSDEVLTESQNEYEFLTGRIRQMTSRTQRLERELSEALPLAYERCFLQVLKNGDLRGLSDLRAYLRKQGRDFIHPVFQTGLIHIVYSASFFKRYSDQEFISVSGSAKKLLRTKLPSDWLVYLVSLEPNLICVVVNIPEDVSPESLPNRLRAFFEDVSEDGGDVRFSGACGLPFKEPEGMIRSYEQARSAKARIVDPWKGDVVLYQEFTRSPFKYSTAEENKLYNLISGGKTDDAVQYIREIIADNIDSGSDLRILKMLCLNIYNTVLRAANSLHTNPETVMGKDFLDISAGYEDTDFHTLEAYLLAFTRSLSALNEGGNRKGDTRKVIEYINSHYRENVYLEMLAEKFGVSYKYLSRQLKEDLGVPFHTYFSGLRIEEAKRLLRETDDPVAEIAGDVGYESLNTFYRVFKAREGVTAGEYRTFSQPLKNNNTKEED